MSILVFASGLVFLIIGAELLVEGASRMAAGIGVSPLVIGLTVVAFGTSAPELAVSIKSALSDQADIALGNVVGSNIFNVLFILGLSALIVPLRVSQQLLRLDVPLMIGLSVLVLLFSLDQNISRINGLILVLGLAVYVIFLFFQSRKDHIKQSHTPDQEYGTENEVQGQWVMNTVLVLGGLFLLVLGARWLVNSAVSFARLLGVNELVIGLTIVAAGTSLPEVVTSVIAAIGGERDIAVGNVVGSNVFNIMGVLGFASILAPAGIEVDAAVIRFDLPVMIAVTFACLPLFFTAGTINRWEGGVLLGYYLAYTLYLVLAAYHHASLPWFSAVMLYFIIPLTLLTIITIAVQEFRGKSKPHGD